MSRLRTELDDLREKHRERDRTREEELQSTKDRLQVTTTEKVSFIFRPKCLCNNFGTVDY